MHSPGQPYGCPSSGQVQDYLATSSLFHRHGHLLSFNGALLCKQCSYCSEKSDPPWGIHMEFDKWGSNYCLKWHNEMSCGSSFYQGDIHSLQMGQISSLDLVSLALISLYSFYSYTNTKQIFNIQKRILFLGSQFWDRNACFRK